MPASSPFKLSRCSLPCPLCSVRAGCIGVSGFMGAGQLGGIFLGRKRLIQLRHGLDALHDLEPQPQLQYIGNIGRYGRLYGACPGVESDTTRWAAGMGACPHTMR